MPEYPKCFAKFKKSSIEKMKELIHESKEIEHGAILCMEKGTKKINLRNTCKGTECDVEIEKGCPNGEIEFGEFHTHPQTPLPAHYPDDIPSSGDWLNWITNEYNLSCLGTKNVLNCYQPKYDPVFIDGPRPENIDMMNKIGHTVTKINTCEEFIGNHPEPKDQKREPVLKNLMRYTKDLEKYYYRFSPEECIER